ncbi:PREDICTED: uncharacterized protein LOC105458719, partial [Wasmannia auropunctata]|uniref:uncharacterized protein LOC105458719 n=1 Tax=Wasmannia auropunctata TaxID=64793 RepID=UPI0005EEFB36
MANPAEYVSSNVTQKRAVLMIVNEFVKNLKSISGTCMDVGCGPGDTTNNILLPTLDPNATIIAGGTIFVLFLLSHDAYEVLKNFKQDVRFASYIPNPKKYLTAFFNLVLPNEDLKDLLESILLENVGFNVQHCSLREMNFSEINADTVLRSIFSLFTFLNAMPPELQEEFKVEFSREYKNYKIKLCGN